MHQAPTITLHVFGPLRTYCAGAAELSFPADTVRSALAALEQQQSVLHRHICDETGTLRQHLNVFVNTNNIRDRDGLDTRLVAGDVISILPAVSGG